MTIETTLKQTGNKLESYYVRNQRWINPFVAGVILATTPMLMGAIVEPSAAPVPQWLTTAGLTLAGLAAGLGAAITDTSSGRAIRFIGTAFGVAVLLLAAFP